MGEIKGGKVDAAASPASHGIISIADQRAGRRTRPWDEEFGTATEDEAKPEYEWSRGHGKTGASSASARASTTYANLDIYHDLSEGNVHSTRAFFVSLVAWVVGPLFPPCSSLTWLPSKWGLCSVRGGG